MGFGRFHGHMRVSFQLVVSIGIFGCVATADELSYLLSPAVTPNGDLYVADRNLPGIWKIVDGKLKPFFKGSKKFRTPLNAVRCLVIDEKGNLLAGDTSTRQVYRFGDSAKPDPLLANPTGLGIPMSIAVDKNGTIFVADLETHRIWKVPSAGGEPVEFVTVPAPRGLAIDDSGRLWVVSHGKDQLLRISADGKLEPVVRDRPFRFPHNVVIDQQHVAYVSDGYAKTIWKVNDLGETQAWITGEPLVNPVGLAWSGENLIIVDPQARAVFEADKDGKLTTVLSAAD